MRIATRARERPRANEGRNNPLSAPMRIMLAILATACGTLCATVAAAAPGAPARLVLPVDGTTFYVNTMAFSASGDQLCLAGTDPDDMATTTVHFLLIDRVRNAVAWRTKLAVPNDLANIYPIKCLVTADRVYVLANADTSLSPPIAETQTHVIAFDLHGRRKGPGTADLPQRVLRDRCDCPVRRRHRRRTPALYRQRRLRTGIDRRRHRQGRAADGNPGRTAACGDARPDMGRPGARKWQHARARCGHGRSAASRLSLTTKRQ